ncbi:MAG: hypothetical protein ACOY3K_01370 [Candidatus Omnitrophota bacterium]
MIRKTIVFGIAIGVLALAAHVGSQFLAGAWVERKLGLEIEKNFRPSLWGHEFKWNGIRGEWKERLEIVSGDVRVRYGVGRELLDGALRIRVSSDNLCVRFRESWLKDYGVDALNLERFVADILIGDQGVREIHELRIQSPKINFEISADASAAGSRTEME